MIVKVGKDYARTVLASNVDYSKQDRDSNAVYQFSISKVNYEATATRIKLPPALSFNPFTS